jgi:hypothetical protein
MTSDGSTARVEGGSRFKKQATPDDNLQLKNKKRLFPQSSNFSEPAGAHLRKQNFQLRQKNATV